MRNRVALNVAPLIVAAVGTALGSCSVWAALDKPYKGDVSAAEGGEAGDGGDPVVDGAMDGREVSVAVRALDAGFVPSAIGAYGDIVYAVDDQAQVHVARNASVNFTNFWSGDAGGVFLIQRNGIAANATGVFWTVSTGVRYCGVDAGSCGFLASTNARSIAASDSVVAWIDDMGVRVCGASLDTCNPLTLRASRNAIHLAAGPNGAVAWTEGATIIHLAGGPANSLRDLFPYEVDLLATDVTSGDLWWEGMTGIGLVQFDGGGDTKSMLTSSTKPTALFVRGGVAYWSLGTTPSVVQHCRLDADAGCMPRDLAPSGLRPPATTHEIIANSRKVLAIVTSGMSLFQPSLVEWPLPP